MRASVIIRSKDEADRLRLTLKSLALQTEAAEVVVVNDGSTDHTRAVIDEASRSMTIVAVHHDAAIGRSGAANVGAKIASGDILIFLDGDTLAGRDFVQQHMSVHRDQAGTIARGETHHLRCTRFFADPEAGTPRPGEEDRVSAMSPSEFLRAKVTMQDIEEDFSSIHRRSQKGVYPGAGPRQLFDLEMEALRDHRDCEILWMAASGSNQSVSRDAFLKTGGFNLGISINEHRELALRLCNAGLRMAPVDGAYSYHLTHRVGWRDPVVEKDWEKIFYTAHPLPVVPLMSVFWASISDPVPFPKEARITSIPHLDSVARRYQGIWGAEEVRQAHFRTAVAEV